MMDGKAANEEGAAQVDFAALMRLAAEIPRLAGLACKRREQLFGKSGGLVHAPEVALAPGENAYRLRQSVAQTLTRWPLPEDVQAGDRLVLRIDADAHGVWLEYLTLLAGHAADAGPVYISPVTDWPSATYRMWLIASARLVLPGVFHIAARFDHLGNYLAQIALACGADTLCGPLSDDRALPIAGVTRPTERSHAAMKRLLEQAGLHLTPEGNRW